MESVNKGDVLRNWLIFEGKLREELATELGVSKRTIDNWCAGREIPAVKWSKIEKLMNKPSFCYSSVIALPIRFTQEEWKQVKATIPPNVDAEVYLRDLLLPKTDVADDVVLPAPTEMPVPYIPAAQSPQGPTC